jgi:hypothetical protein
MEGSFYNGIQWPFGSRFSVSLYCFPAPIKLVTNKATNFGEVMCNRFFSNSGMPYTFKSTFLEAFQEYMASLI